MKNAERLTKWKEAVRRESWTPNKYSFLCSNHFTPDCFESRHDDQHRQLKATAVPTIFDFSEKIRSSNPMVRRKVVSKRLSLSNDESSSEESTRILDQKEVNKWTSSNSDSILDLSIHPANHLQEGEWTREVDGDIFTPSSCSLIGALHSYSYTSRLQRKRSGPQTKITTVRSEPEILVTPTSATETKTISVYIPDLVHRRLLSKKKAANRTYSHMFCYSHKVPSFQAERLISPQRRMKRRRLQSVAHHMLLKLRKMKEQQKRGKSSLTLHSSTYAVPLHPSVKPLEWMLGSWQSDEPGHGSFPTIQPFRYTESLHISHVGQPMLNFLFTSFNAETKKPLHRECGFIRMEPKSNKVAFIIAHNLGLVEIEEGNLNGRELKLQSTALSRISFAKQPYVQEITRTFRLMEDGRLEQELFMATDNQPLNQHLHIYYKKLQIQQDSSS
ncbi:THAP4 protein, partial [Polypterus senegalus]